MNPKNKFAAERIEELEDKIAELKRLLQSAYYDVNNQELRDDILAALFNRKLNK